MWWPSGSDPFYLANTVDNTARQSYYGITGTPSVKCDGSTASWPSIQSIMESRLLVTSNLWLDLEGTVNGSTLNVIATAVADRDISGNIVIHLVLLDRYTYLVSPNGMNNHYHVMLDMAPSASGQAFAATANDTMTFTGSFSLSPSWNIANLDMAAFVQNNDNHDVLQAHCEQVPVDFPGLTYQSHTIEDEDLDGRVEPGESALMYVTLSNGQSFQPATNVVGTLSATDPTLIITTPTVDFPDIPNGGTGTNADPFVFAVSSSATPHESSLHLQVVADPQQTTYDVDIPIFIGWPYIFLVDDDGGAGTTMETYYFSTLQAMGEAYEYWEIATQGVPTLDQVAGYSSVIWFTAYGYSNVLSPSERTLIEGYLSQGGNLFINGQNLAWGLSEQAPTFLSQTLHASYLINDPSIRILPGVAGNPVGDGLTMNINSGGSGSGSATSPDGIGVLAPAQEAFTYQGSATYKGGLTYEDETSGHKLVFFSIPFEAVNGIAPSNTREEVLGAILDFFRSGPAIEVSSSSLDFDSVLVGQQRDLGLTIYSIGTETLVLTGVTNSLAVFTHNFDPADSLLAPGDSLQLTVTFVPTDSLTYEDVLSIANNAAPCEVELVGQGLPLVGIIGDAPKTIPTEFALQNAYPNPFNPATVLAYQLPVAGRVTLQVFDLAGHQVVTLADGRKEAGYHEAIFDGFRLASGIYLYRLTAEGFTASGKMVLMK